MKKNCPKQQTQHHHHQPFQQSKWGGDFKDKNNSPVKQEPIQEEIDY